MSFEPLIWALSLGADNGLTSTTKSVLIAMANHCGDRKGGACFPSHETLARETLFSERTVGTAVRDLAEHGFLTVITQGNGRGQISRYVLHVDLTITARRAERPDPDAMLTEKVASVTGKVETHVVKVEAVSEKVERVADKPPLNHPEPPIELIPLASTRASPKAAARKSSLEEGWKPSADGIQFAESRGLDPDTVLGTFRDHHMSKRSLMADWSAAWRLWCRNEVKFGRARAPQIPPLLAAADATFGDDPFGARAWAARHPDAVPGKMQDGSLVPCVAGYDLAGVAFDVCVAAGLKSNWRGDLGPVAVWLGLGIDPDTIIRAVMRANKPADLRTLRYFDAAVRELAGR